LGFEIWDLGFGIFEAKPGGKVKPLIALTGGKILPIFLREIWKDGRNRETKKCPSDLLQIKNASSKRNAFGETCN
jgi:hypothetical protein